MKIFAHGTQIDSPSLEHLSAEMPALQQKKMLPSPISFNFSLLFLFLFGVEDFCMVAKLVLTAAPINCKLLSKVFSDQVMQLRAALHKDVHWLEQVCAKKIVQKGAFMKCTIELHG